MWIVVQSRVTIFSLLLGWGLGVECVCVWGGGKSIGYLLTICGFKASWDFKFEYDCVSFFLGRGGGGRRGRMT